MLDGGGEVEKREKPQALNDYAELFAASLKARVRVLQGKRKGKIIIEFKGEKDLERLLKEMTGAAREI
jgi:hypothetical protein